MNKPFRIPSIIVLLFPFLLALPCSLHAQNAPDAEELTSLLNEFLDGASAGEAEIHDRFWAEDLIYTSSAGQRIGKNDIMQSLNDSVNEDSGVTYSAEEIQIQQYGNTAIVAFRLVGVTGSDDRTDYYNTGTFLKRGGKWQVVSWQATRIPNE